MSAVMSHPPFEANTALTAVAEFFDLGDLRTFRFAANGIENLNYFITTDSNTRQYIVSFLVKPPQAEEAYIDMMDTLDAAGLPVAPPLRNTKGARSTTYADKTALLQRCIPGRHTLNPTFKQIRSLGRFMAHMHRTMLHSDIELPAYPRDVQWLQSNAEAVCPHLPYSDSVLLKDSVTRIRSLLSRSDTSSLPCGMIHGDLFRDNVLFSEKGLTGVLDFHHAAQGFWIYDLAVAANDWCSDNGGVLDKDRTTALLRAYHEVRPLTQEEVWLFPMFGLYAAVSFWLSRLMACTPVPGSASAESSAPRAETGLIHRTKNPDEMKAIVAHHTAHQFYLDTRLLD